MTDKFSLICAECNRPFADRERDTCAYCGAPIPMEAQMSAEQKREMAKIKENEYKSYRKWKEATKAKQSSRTLEDID